MTRVRCYVGMLALVGLLFAFTGVSDAVAAEKKVGVMWIGSSGMAERVTKGFIEVMKSDAPDVDVEFKVKLPDEAAALKVFEKWQESKDAIVFLRSSGAKFLGKHESKVPCFFGGCSNPVILGAVDSFDSPGGQNTGVTYYINAAERVAVFKKVFPELSSVGLIVEKGHPSSAIDASETKAACEALGLTYAEVQCTKESEFLKAGKEMSQKVDLIILGSQAKCASQAPKLAGLVGKTPMASYNPKAIKGIGALLGLNADDAELGRILAGSVIEVIVDGKSIADVPVKLDPAPAFLLNETMVKKLGVSIPEEMASKAKMTK